LELLAACHNAYRLERGSLIDIRRIASHPLLMPDSSFKHRKTFDAVCERARLNPDILIESRTPHALLALAEAGLGIAIISTAVRTDRYALRVVRIADRRKPIRVPQAIVWDKRRVLPRYAQDFCELLAARMRKPLSIANSGAQARRRTK
jgi:DNA-binding transcriptional LysR family regulator